MMKLALGIVFLLSWASAAEATCTGSGKTWSCTAGTTVAQVNTAMNSAIDGATFTFAAGAYNWSDTYIYLKDAKGVTLICATQHACTVTVGAGPTIFGDDFEGINTKLYRISGFTFSGTVSKAIWFDRYQPTGLEKLTNIRIDHNRFINMSANAYAMFLGAGGLSAYGVVDHNELTNAANATLAFVNGPTTETITGTRGTADAIFFEDNTVTITAPTNNGMAAGCIDGWGAGSVVWRHNTTTNCFVSSHGVTHSWGPVNWEVYNNSFVFNAAGAAIGHGTGERALQHQGSGEILVFNNTATATGTKSLNVFTVGHYRSEASCSGIGTCGSPFPLNTVCDGTSVADGNRPGQIAGREGYPCKRQPARDSAARLQPMYAWNNRWADTGEQLKLVKIASKAHIMANREYYNAVSKDAQTSPTSPFNGTHNGFVTAGNYGMGFGTLANRPTTCTPTDLADDAGYGGVGYFATDAGTMGTLYRCSAPNTWTVQYTPYTYPHPLQNGLNPAPPSGPPSGPPATPANFKVTPP